MKLGNRADVVDVWPKLPDERPIYLSALARTPNPNPLPPLSGKPVDETFLSMTKGRIGSDECVATAGQPRVWCHDSSLPLS